MRSTDPERMSNEAILAELGELLAAGFQRHITTSIGRSEEGANPPNPLEASADVEAKCANKSKEAHE